MTSHGLLRLCVRKTTGIKMTVQDLIEQLQTMPLDAKVYYWVDGKRQEVIEARDVGDCVDLYNEDDQ